MDEKEDDPLPDWAPLVLAHAREPLRGALSALLRLDGKLSRIIGSSTEPALAQIRLAWWRDELLRLRENGSPSPADPLLADILDRWDGRFPAVTALIDGWEELLNPQPWDEGVRERFADGHVAAFRGLAEIAGRPDIEAATPAHARQWAQAKLSLFAPDFVIPNPGRLPALPRALRSLAIIGGLSRRAVLRGGKPLFGDRMSPLVALRLGILGT